jgi:hypothetical protein
MDAMKDEASHRRKHVRREVQLPARLRIGTVEVPATTENISVGGAFLRVALPSEAKELVASIELPHGKDLHVRAKVRWRRGDPPGPPGVGVSFETFMRRPGEPDLKKLLR